MRDNDGIDVPELCQRLDVSFVLPIAKAGKITIGTGLSVVLSSRLTVHLEDPSAWPTNHAAQ